MVYYFSKYSSLNFDETVEKTIAELKAQGFGVLTEIDVTQTLKKKLNADFRPYRILGACNPPYAYKALQSEDKIGTMLPCNVIVQQTEDGRIEVAAIDPIASMSAVDNPELQEIAEQIREKLKKVIDSI